MSAELFHTIEQIDVVSCPLSPDVGQRTGLLEGRPTRTTRRNHDPGAKLGQLEKLSAVQRNLLKLLILNNVADFAGRELKEWDRGGDRDLLRDLTQL